MITAAQLYDCVQLSEAAYTLFDQATLPPDGTPLGDTALAIAVQLKKGALPQHKRRLSR